VIRRHFLALPVAAVAPMPTEEHIFLARMNHSLQQAVQAVKAVREWYAEAEGRTK
jgi:hypothetical protein